MRWAAAARARAAATRRRSGHFHSVARRAYAARGWSGSTLRSPARLRTPAWNHTFPGHPTPNRGRSALIPKWPLNTKVQQDLESTTYTRLRELRDALPGHTYLQYTATPQAPLLINIADTLSPDFV